MLKHNAQQGGTVSAVLRQCAPTTNMKNNDKNDYKVCFSGTTISKNEANEVGVALILEFIGIVVIGSFCGNMNKLAVGFISLILAGIGYWGIANRLFEKK